MRLEFVSHSIEGESCLNDHCNSKGMWLAVCKIHSKYTGALHDCPFGLTPIFANIILLDHNYVSWFMQSLQLFLWYKNCVDGYNRNLYDLQD